MDELLKVVEVAELLRVSESTVRNLIKRGAFPTVRIGRAMRVKGSDVVEYVKSCTVSVDLSTFDSDEN